MLGQNHISKLKEELKSVDMTSYGHMNLSTDYVPNNVYKNENIKGVIYGRLDKGVDSVTSLGAIISTI